MKARVIKSFLKLSLAVGMIVPLAGFIMINDEVLAKSQDLVARGQSDPEATRFKNVVVFRSDDREAIYVCGDFNVKNTSGGYTGYQTFLVKFTEQDSVLMTAPGTVADEDIQESQLSSGNPNDPAYLRGQCFRDGGSLHFY